MKVDEDRGGQHIRGRLPSPSLSRGWTASSCGHSRNRSEWVHRWAGKMGLRCDGTVLSIQYISGLRKIEWCLLVPCSLIYIHLSISMDQTNRLDIVSDSCDGKKKTIFLSIHRATGLILFSFLYIYLQHTMWEMWRIVLLSPLCSSGSSSSSVCQFVSSVSYQYLLQNPDGLHLSWNCAAIWCRNIKELMSTSGVSCPFGPTAPVIRIADLETAENEWTITYVLRFLWWGSPRTEYSARRSSPDRIAEQEQVCARGEKAIVWCRFPASRVFVLLVLAWSIEGIHILSYVADGLSSQRRYLDRRRKQMIQWKTMVLLYALPQRPDDEAIRLGRFASTHRSGLVFLRDVFWRRLRESGCPQISIPVCYTMYSWL